MIETSADAARQLLTAMAAAVITVVGVVFSITIVALTLASTQFGPRMLRNFIRDRGTQHTLGAFVATFVFSILALVAIGNGAHAFVPHISVTVAMLALVLDMGVLIYFINHITESIQLPQVIASIARDLGERDRRRGLARGRRDRHRVEPLARGDRAPDGRVERRRADRARGYLQFVHYDTLVRIASNAERGDPPALPARPLPRRGPSAGDGLAAGARPPRSPAASGAPTSPARYRTLAQDLSFAVDQLVEIAIRALSPAVNDTFTALTCIDWLGEGLCRIAAEWAPTQIHRDASGQIRLISAAISYRRIVERAYEKIRQASRGMPAVMIRQLDSLAKVMEYAATAAQREVLVEQARRIQAACERTVPEASDRADVSRRYEAVRRRGTWSRATRPPEARRRARVPAWRAGGSAAAPTRRRGRAASRTGPSRARSCRRRRT